jgi:DNA-binding transcriptional MerR regulator
LSYILVYRVYSQKHLILLQQILIYRELDFSIDEIKSLLNAEDHDDIQVLAKQKSLLLGRQQTITKMIDTIDLTMDSIRGKKNFEILFEDIPKEKTDCWNEIAIERIGEQKIADGMSAFANISNSEVRNLKIESDRITQEFAKTIGQPFDSYLVQKITQEHYELSNKMSHLVTKTNEEIDIGYQEYVFMANSVDVQEVNEMCEYYGEGYAEHARLAMIYFADTHLKN